MRKCPICRMSLEVKDYSDSMYAESYETCRDGCEQYHFEEWCGNFRTALGDTELIEGWNSSKKHVSRNKFIYKRKIARLRKAYRKSKK